MLIHTEGEDVDTDDPCRMAAGLPRCNLCAARTSGQREFIARGPNGVLIDVITPIEPSDAFKPHLV